MFFFSNVLELPEPSASVLEVIRTPKMCTILGRHVSAAPGTAQRVSPMMSLYFFFHVLHGCKLVEPYFDWDDETELLDSLTYLRDAESELFSRRCGGGCCPRWNLDDGYGKLHKLKAPLISYPSEVFPNGLTWDMHRGVSHATMCDSCASAVNRGLRVEHAPGEQPLCFQAHDYTNTKERPSGVYRKGKCVRLLLFRLHFLSRPKKRSVRVGRVVFENTESLVRASRATLRSLAPL